MDRHEAGIFSGQTSTFGTTQPQLTALLQAQDIVRVGPYETMPVKPLSFKGDKKSKKRKHQSTTDLDAPPSNEVAQQPAAEPKEDGDDTWVTAEAPTDIVGPVVLVLPSDSPSCLACDAIGKVFSSELENLVEGDPATAEPHDVRQVWVASRVVGSEHTIFKGHHGR